MKYFALALVSIAIATPALAQKLVDPASVAPEFREAAESVAHEAPGAMRIVNMIAVSH